MAKRRVKFVAMATLSLCLLTVVRKPCENMQFRDISERRRPTCSKTHTVPSYKSNYNFKMILGFVCFSVESTLMYKITIYPLVSPFPLVYLSPLYLELKKYTATVLAILGLLFLRGKLHKNYLSKFCCCRCLSISCII